MKNQKLTYCGILATVLATVLVAVLSAILLKSDPGLCESDVEALSSCEVTGIFGQVIFSCSGNEGECKETYKGHTLLCSGTKN